MDFEEFCNNSENINRAQKIQEQTSVNYEDMVKKYSGKSSNELYAEFIKLAQSEKEKGNLTKTQLDNIYSTLAPMMSEQEKEKLKNLLNMIG